MQIVRKVETLKKVLKVGGVQFSKETIQRNREREVAKLAKMGRCQLRAKCARELIV